MKKQFWFFIIPNSPKTDDRGGTFIVLFDGTADLSSGILFMETESTF